MAHRNRMSRYRAAGRPAKRILDASERRITAASQPGLDA
jgi:hypothetical protein